MITMMSNIINEYVDNVYYKSSDFLLRVRICLRSFVFLFMNVIAFILLRIDFAASEDPIIKIYHKNRWLIITTWFNVSMKNNHNSLKKSLGTLMIIFLSTFFSDWFSIVVQFRYIKTIMIILNLKSWRACPNLRGEEVKRRFLKCMVFENVGIYFL